MHLYWFLSSWNYIKPQRCLKYRAPASCFLSSWNYIKPQPLHPANRCGGVFYHLEITSNHNYLENDEKILIVFYHLEITSNHNDENQAKEVENVFYHLEITSNHNQL